MTPGVEDAQDGVFTFSIQDGSGNPLITDVDTTVEFFISGGVAVVSSDYDIVAPSLIKLGYGVG